MDSTLSKTSDAFLQGEGSAVDCHFHVFVANVAVPGARYRPTYAAEPNDWMGKAAACGVRRGLLVQPSFLGTDNSQMLRAMAESGHALRGVAVIDPATAEGELRALHAQGVRGIRLNLVGISHDVRAWTQADTLWKTMDDLGWHLELHTDQGALTGVLAQLLPVLPATLCLVLDHFGKPASASATDETVVAVQEMVKNGRPVYVKLSGAYRIGAVDPKAMAQQWLQVLGPSQLLWGSDWPCTNHESLADYAQLHANLEDWLGDSAWVRQVRVDNPHRLLA